jgi:hypothetical protein
MHVHDLPRLAVQVDDPVERRVATAEDHEPLTVKIRGIADAVVDLLVLENVTAFDSEPPRLERAQPRSDDDRASDELRIEGRAQVKAPILEATQSRDLLAEVKLAVERVNLLHEPVHEFCAPQMGNAGMS